jgi:hypothetical protein
MNLRQERDKVPGLFFVLKIFGCFERLARPFLGERRVATRRSVGTFRQISLRTVEKGFGSPKVFGSMFLRTGCPGGGNRLTRVAHFLYWGCRAT